MKMLNKLATLALATGLLCFGQSAMAQRGGGFGGGGNIISQEAVQKELNLSAEQIEKLKTITEESGKAMREMFSGGRGQPGGAAPDRDAMREKMEKLTKETTEKVNGILTAEQKQRLLGLTIQSQGTRAFSSPEVADALKLTEDQKTKIKTIGEEIRSSFQGGGQGGRPDFTKIQEAMKTAETKIMDVLTSEQKETLEKLKGAKFDMPRPQFGGRGGPGGAAPGGRPGQDAPAPGGDKPGDAPKPTPRPEPEL